jgi:crotonobetainyl-CoA:carnitine CoA-transferase CaiB-like acyl-CoA transferase
MLDDVTVLDLGDEATALAGELLAELGARVVRVEDEGGDVVRSRGRHWHAVNNAGKRSIAIDTTTDAGWAPILALLDSVDVVIGPLEAGPATRRFVASAAARAAGDPASGLGVVEVVARRGAEPEPVTDLTLTAAGGLVWLCGETDDPPNHPAGDLGFKQVSLVAAEAALALVTAARRTGRAGHVVVSAQEAVVVTTLQTANANLHFWHGAVPDRHAKLAAHTTVASADGLWTSFTIHPPNFGRFASWAERELGDTGLTGPEWLDLDHVAANRARVADVVRRLAGVTTRDDLVREGQERGLLVLPVNEVADVAADPHLAARDFFVTVDDGSGPLRLAGSPFRSDRGRMTRGPAPRLGADGHLLAELAARPRPRPVPRAVPLAVPPVVDGTDGGPTPAEPGPPLPLAGIRIVDFCWAIAGPLGTRLLADLGADVIKVESGHRLDPIRYIGPQPPDLRSVDTNGVFNDCSANKRAVTLNLDTEDGRALAARLIATADVVTANFTPDRLDRWGFDRDSLEALRPGLIVANLAVMGTWGPNAGWRSYGSGLVAMGGLAAHTGFEGRVPECLGTLHTDFTVPWFAASFVLAALHHRDRTGEGAYLELSQYETAVRLLDVELADVLAGRPGPGRRANRSPWCRPHGVYPAAGHDRWVAVAARDDRERRALAAVVGRPDAGDPGPAGEDPVAAWTATRSRSEIVATLREAGVPVSAVEDLADHQRDPTTAGLWTTIDLPAGVAARVINQPITWNGERLPLRPAPMWNEHTWEVVVDELGVDPEAFARLDADGVFS